MKMAMESDKFVLLPDQTYKNIAYDMVKNDATEYSDSDSNDDSDLSAEEYLKEMESILRKIRKKRTKISGTFCSCFETNLTKL
jgi:hypothetical protein